MSPMPRMRCASRSGWNGSRPSVRSPVPRKLIGRPVAARMLSAAPPRASPSIFVSTSPVTGSLAWNASATRTDSWPVIASTTSSVSAGVTTPEIRTSSSIIASSTWRRPAVSRIMTSTPAGLRRFEPGARHLEGGRADRARVDLHADLVAELHELVDGRGPVDVGGHEERALPILAQPDGELRGRCRLARALEADEHQDRRLRVETGADAAPRRGRRRARRGRS